MKGSITGFSKKDVKGEIIYRMEAGLDSSGEEYSNEDLMKDFIQLEKNEFLKFLKDILPWNPRIKVRRIREKIKELDTLQEDRD